MLGGLVKVPGSKRAVKSKAVTIVKDDTYYRKVAEKAYELYEQRGCGHGSDWEDWFQAEKEVGSALGSAVQEFKPKRSAKRF